MIIDNLEFLRTAFEWAVYLEFVRWYVRRRELDGAVDN